MSHDENIRVIKNAVKEQLDASRAHTLQPIQANQQKSTGLAQFNKDGSLVQMTDGTVYNAIKSGSPQDVDSGIKLSQNTVLMQRDAVKVIRHQTGAKFYAILQKFDGTYYTYWLININDASDPSKYYKIDTLTVANATNGFSIGNWAYVRFAPSGKHIFVSFDQSIDPSGANSALPSSIKSGWAQNWSLGKDGSSNNVVKWQSLKNRSINLDGSTLPQAPIPPAPAAPDPTLGPSGIPAATRIVINLITTTTDQELTVSYNYSLFDSATGPQADIYGSITSVATVTSEYSTQNFYGPGGLIPGTEFFIFPSNSNRNFYLFDVLDELTVASVTTGTQVFLDVQQPSLTIQYDYETQETVTGSQWLFANTNLFLVGVQDVFKKQTTPGYSTGTSKQDVAASSSNAGYWIVESDFNYLNQSPISHVQSFTEFGPFLVTDTHYFTSGLSGNIPSVWKDSFGNVILLKALDSEVFATLNLNSGGKLLIQKWQWDTVKNIPVLKKGLTKPSWDQSAYTVVDWAVI